MKIVFVIGKLIKIDRVIVMRDILYYVRIFVEVLIDDELYDIVFFENEWGGILYYLLYYEWKLVKCIKCSMFGYLEDVCKKGVGKRVWREKNKDINVG